MRRGRWAYRCTWVWAIGLGFCGATFAQPDGEAKPSGESLLSTPVDPPLGFAGRSGVAAREEQESSHFIPMEDRWRMGFPEWDRYDQGHPLGKDHPYKTGRWWDPYNQNVLKGDYPI